MGKLIVNMLDNQRLLECIRQERSKNTKQGDNLRKLADELSSALLYAPTEIPPDVVTMNSRVTITNLADNRQQTITLVYPADADVASKKISIIAPIATALLGYRVGDVVEWMVPKGNISIRIDAILYQPESSGNFLL